MFTDVADLYAANPALFAGSVFVLGLVVGSFLNVVIYRLPIMLEREWRAQAAEILPRRPLQPPSPANAADAPGIRRPPRRPSASTWSSRAPPVPHARPRSPPGRTSP